jgi:hypothetical protein
MHIQYHATPYKSKILDNGFDINTSYKERNEQLGAGQAVYFTDSIETAQRYLNANANDSFLPIIIEEAKKKDFVTGYLLENLYKYGYEKAWQMLEDNVKTIYADYDENISEFDNYRKMVDSYYDTYEYDLNDVGDVSTHIRGSKTIEAEDNTVSFFNTSSYLPEMIIEDARKMGITTLPEDAEIISMYLDSKAKIKDVGDTEDSVKEAEIAKQEGYDGIYFKNQYSINDDIELAIFNTEVIKLIFEIENNINEDNINILLIENIIETIEHIDNKEINNIKNIILTQNGLLLDNENISKSFRNILSILYKLKIIDIKPGNEIDILISSKNIYEHLLIVELDNKIDILKNRLISDRKYVSNTKFYDKNSNKTKVKSRPKLF